MIGLREPTRDEITRLAYALYLLRGCEPGSDVEDWVKAEKELCDQLMCQPRTLGNGSRRKLLPSAPGLVGVNPLAASAAQLSSHRGITFLRTACRNS